MRTYRVDHFANQEKQNAVFAVLFEYRKVCYEISKKQWRLFFGSEKMDKMADLQYLESPISERYKRNCAYQAHSQLQSYFSNRQNDFVSMVHASSLDKETKIKLFCISLSFSSPIFEKAFMASLDSSRKLLSFSKISG